MRILHVLAWMDPKMGGVSQAVKSIITGLKRHGIENEIVSLDGTDLKLDESFGQFIATGPGSTPWFYSSKLSSWLMLNLCRFDIVILHGLWLYHSYALRKAVFLLKAANQKSVDKKKPVPLIYTMPHGMLDPYFQQSKTRKLKAIRNWFYWKIIEHKIIKDSSGLLFTSLEERKLAATTFTPYLPNKEFVVGLGIETPPYRNEDMTKAFYTLCPEVAGKSYLLFLGRIDEKKGIDLLLNAYLDVQKKNEELPEDERYNFPDLVIAGPGSESKYGQGMKSLAIKSKANIHFPGMLSGISKWGALYNCDAFALTSHQENFGIAIVEALACGKPVLISNKVNIWSEISETESGFVSDNTLTAIKDMLWYWLSLNNKEKKVIGENGFKTFNRSYSIDNFSKNLINVLK